MTKKISIIIPAYKVAGYIEKCIRSLENQDLSKDDYEIIVTNDGSPDNCREIVESLQQEFSNIVLINQENQGVSMARNNAIAIAKGKYILPIDPDDYVFENTLSTIYEEINRSDLDIYCLNYCIEDSKKQMIWESDFSNFFNKVYKGSVAYKIVTDKHIKDPDRSWAILYKTELLKRYDIYYPKDIPFLEDGIFIASIFSVADKVGFSDKKFYRRTVRKGSATRSNLYYSFKSINGLLQGAFQLLSLQKDSRLTSEQKKALNQPIIKFIVMPIIACCSFKSFKHIFAVKKILKEKKISKLDVSMCNEEYTNWGNIYNKSIYLIVVNQLYRNILIKLKLN